MDGKRNKLLTAGWLTSDEVAGYLKLSRDRVCQFARCGRLKAFKLGGRWLRFRVEDVAEFERREMKPAAEQPLHVGTLHVAS